MSYGDSHVRGNLSIKQNVKICRYIIIWRNPFIHSFIHSCNSCFLSIFHESGAGMHQWTRPHWPFRHSTCSQGDKRENQLFISAIRATIKDAEKSRKCCLFPRWLSWHVFDCYLQIGQVHAGPHSFIGCSWDSLLFHHWRSSWRISKIYTTLHSVDSELLPRK